MLSYVPYTFDLYAPLPRYLHASAARMVSIARRDGVCWWSIRTFARLVGISKSTASRHLDLLTRPVYGFASRRRAADGSGYEYTIAQKFLARGAVSHGRAPGVPRGGPKNITAKNKEASRDNFGVNEENWPARMLGWRHPQPGRRPFWLPSWGARPGETGCRVPPELLAH
jgi:hypothetical protein